MRYLTFIILSITLLGCKTSRNEIKETLDTQYKMIENFAQSTLCTDPNDWKITQIQTICGLTGFLYHKDVDKAKLDKMIQEYNTMMKNYSGKYFANVECGTVSKPTGIVCENKKAVLKYD